MSKKHESFPHWLYRKAKEGAREALFMTLIVGGLSLAVLSFCFGIRTPVVLSGIPVGLLLMLYGFFKMNQDINEKCQSG